jgi:hypothetical protein
MNKKKTHFHILNWIKDAWLKAIVVFLIIGVGFYAYAAITWPGDEPNPTTGVVGMFVGESTAAYGNTTNSYDKVNALCAQHTNPNFVGSHVCSSAEMMNSYNHGKVGVAAIFTYLPGGSTMLYINNGPPGYTSNSNDCVGWTKTTPGTDPQNPNYGAVWNFQAQAGGLAPCNGGKKFACCK